MTHDELQEIRETVVDAIKHEYGADTEQHKMDHEFIRILREREAEAEQRKEDMRKIMTTVKGWMVITGLSAVLAFLVWIGGMAYKAWVITIQQVSS